MASLLGKADPTLVRGAFMEAAADVPLDLSDIYTKREANLKAFTEGLQKAWGDLSKAYDDQKQRISDSAGIAFDNMLGGKHNDAVISALDGAVNGIKAEFQNLPGKYRGNTIAHRKLESETKRLASVSKQNGEIFNSLAELSRNDGLLMRGGSGSSLWEAILNDYNNNTNETNVRYSKEHADFLYSLPGNPEVSMTLTELNKELTKRDGTAPTAVQGVLTSIKNDAVSGLRKWDENYITENKNHLERLLRLKNDRANIMNEKFAGMKYSFYDALTGKDINLQEQIYSALEALPGIGLDIDKDGVKDSRDIYTIPGNGYALQKAIIESDYGKEIIADYLIQQVGEDSYNIGHEVFKKANKGKGTEAVNLPWRKGIAKAANIKEVAQLDAVIDILNGQKRIRVENQFWTLQNDGNFKVTHEVVEGKTRPVTFEEGKMWLTKAGMIQEAGGRFGNISDNYFDLIDHDDLSPTPLISKFHRDMGVVPAVGTAFSSGKGKYDF